MFFLFYLYGDHLDLHLRTHRVPTRRSSDRWWPLLQVPGSEWMPAAGSATLVLTRRINLALENEIASVLAVEDARFDAMTNNDVDALQLLLADVLHYVLSTGVVDVKAEFRHKIKLG